MNSKPRPAYELPSIRLEDTGAFFVLQLIDGSVWCTPLTKFVEGHEPVQSDLATEVAGDDLEEIVKTSKDSKRSNVTNYRIAVIGGVESAIVEHRGTWS